MKMINKADIDGNGNIVIQNSDNSIVTINKDNPEEIRKLMIDLQNHISELPKQIIDLIMEQNTLTQPPIIGANVYLGLSFLLTKQGVNGISFNVTITNLTKEIRFYNSPFFKLSVPFEKEADTFYLTDKVSNNIVFPKRLEYGEVISEAYLISKGSEEIYRSVIAKDSNATIQAIVSTTLGEIYQSNEYPISKLLENIKYAK